jgi:hypothetical protein
MADTINETMQVQARKNMADAQDQLLKNTATIQEQGRRTAATVQEQFQQAAATSQNLFQQNLALVQDQWRQGLTIMQEQSHQGASLLQDQSQRLAEQWRGTNVAPAEAAQQAQQAWLEGVERLTAQSAQVSNSAFAATWESWQALFGVLNRNQEQSEQWLRQALEQNQAARDTAARLLRDLGEQAQRTQREFQSALAESARTAVAGMQMPADSQAQAPSAEALDELHRKIDDLAAKVEALTAAKATFSPKAPAKA